MGERMTRLRLAKFEDEVQHHRDDDLRLGRPQLLS
jgi:hypothetical protein